ncbi:hypothetical protein HDU67_009822 [Dinochytrium kinnereticum]|nr:hypothetical protein HDU67_009822 [Dinochytrium kinnereticum]
MCVPNPISRLNKPTDKYLCPATTNKDVQFVEFKIRDLQSNKIFFEVKRPAHDINWNESETGRLVFAVGPKELKSFRMIERHYFKDRLLKSFDFSFGFCIPNSLNTWESVYTMPNLDPALIKEIVSSPGKTVSDSFYFVDDKLVMHNKAFYTYY